MACVANLINPSNNESIKKWRIDEIYREAEVLVEKKNKKLNSKENKRGLYWTITEIGI